MRGAFSGGVADSALKEHHTGGPEGLPRSPRWLRRSPGPVVRRAQQGVGSRRKLMIDQLGRLDERDDALSRFVSGNRLERIGPDYQAQPVARPRAPTLIPTPPAPCGHYDSFQQVETLGDAPGRRRSIRRFRSPDVTSLCNNRYPARVMDSILRHGEQRSLAVGLGKTKSTETARSKTVPPHRTM